MQMKPELVVLSSTEAQPSDHLVPKTMEAASDLLPEDFVPGEHDVICQRGKESFEHIGNKRFRQLIEFNIQGYHDANSRRAKTGIVTKIYLHVRSNATKPSCGFVKKDLLTRRWFQVCEKEARDKVGQALRDAIKNIRANSNKRQSRGLSSPSSVRNESRKRACHIFDQKPNVKSDPNSSTGGHRNYDNHMTPIHPSIFKAEINEQSMITATANHHDPDPLAMMGNMLESNFQPVDSSNDLARRVKRKYSLSASPYSSSEYQEQVPNDWSLLQRQWARIQPTNLRTSLGLSSAQKANTSPGFSFGDFSNNANNNPNSRFNDSLQNYNAQFSQPRDSHSTEANNSLNPTVRLTTERPLVAQSAAFKVDGQNWDLLEPTPMNSNEGSFLYQTPF